SGSAPAGTPATSTWSGSPRHEDAARTIVRTAFARPLRHDSLSGVGVTRSSSRGRRHRNRARAPCGLVLASTPRPILASVEVEDARAGRRHPVRAAGAALAHALRLGHRPGGVHAAVE